jgi:hypothetical protein
MRPSSWVAVKCAGRACSQQAGCRCLCIQQVMPSVQWLTPGRRYHTKCSATHFWPDADARNAASSSASRRDSTASAFAFTGRRIAACTAVALTYADPCCMQPRWSRVRARQPRAARACSHLDRRLLSCPLWPPRRRPCCYPCRRRTAAAAARWPVRAPPRERPCPAARRHALGPGLHRQGGLRCTVFRGSAC